MRQLKKDTGPFHWEIFESIEIMLTSYLTADELAELIDCAPTSFACMRRYLVRHGWPFEPNLRGFPKVSRAYFDARISGTVAPSALLDEAAEPDFSMFSQ